MQFPLYTIFLIIGMIIAMIFIAYTFKLKPAENYKILIILAAGCIIWLLGNILDIISTDFGFKIFWNHIASIGVVMVTLSFFFFFQSSHLKYSP